MFTFGIRDRIPSFATCFRNISTRNQSSEMLKSSSTKVHIQGLFPTGSTQHFKGKHKLDATVYGHLLTVAVLADSTVSRLWAGNQWIVFQLPVAVAAARNLHLLHSIQTSSVAFLTPYSVSTKGLTLSVSQHQFLHPQCVHIHPKSAAMTGVNIITNVHLTISKHSAPFSVMLHSYCTITMHLWTGSEFWWWWGNKFHPYKMKQTTDFFVGQCRLYHCHCMCPEQHLTDWVLHHLLHVTLTTSIMSYQKIKCFINRKVTCWGTLMVGHAE